MTDPTRLLALYDAQLRAAAEVPNADDCTWLGPLLLAVYGGRRGFVTYSSLAGFDTAEDGERLDALIARVISHFAALPGVAKLEWKTRGHDRPEDLAERLVRAGFVAEPTESVMVGEAAALAVEAPLPAGFRLERAGSVAEVRQACAVDGRIFEDSPEDAQAYADELAARFTTDPEGFELWLVREPNGAIVATGRLDPVADSDFAGLWGGGVVKEFRGRGLYRALVSARAHSALALGRRYLNSDSTEYSRPILERAGLVKVTTTTPFLWRRASALD